MRPKTAALRIEWSTAAPSSVFLIPDGKGAVLKKLRSATRWHSGLALIAASSTPATGVATEQDDPSGALRFLRERFSRMPSVAAKKKSLSLMIGPPKLPPN